MSKLWVFKLLCGASLITPLLTNAGNAMQAACRPCQTNTVAYAADLNSCKFCRDKCQGFISGAKYAEFLRACPPAGAPGAGGGAAGGAAAAAAMGAGAGIPGAGGGGIPGAGGGGIPGAGGGGIPSAGGGGIPGAGGAGIPGAGGGGVPGAGGAGIPGAGGAGIPGAGGAGIPGAGGAGIPGAGGAGIPGAGGGGVPGAGGGGVPGAGGGGIPGAGGAGIPGAGGGGIPGAGGAGIPGAGGAGIPGAGGGGIPGAGGGGVPGAGGGGVPGAGGGGVPGAGGGQQPQPHQQATQHGLGSLRKPQQPPQPQPGPSLDQVQQDLKNAQQRMRQKQEEAANKHMQPPIAKQAAPSSATPPEGPGAVKIDRQPNPELAQKIAEHLAMVPPFVQYQKSSQGRIFLKQFAEKIEIYASAAFLQNATADEKRRELKRYFDTYVKGDLKKAVQSNEAAIIAAISEALSQSTPGAKVADLLWKKGFVNNSFVAQDIGRALNRGHDPQTQYESAANFIDTDANLRSKTSPEKREEIKEFIRKHLGVSVNEKPETNRGAHVAEVLLNAKIQGVTPEIAQKVGEVIDAALEGDQIAAAIRYLQSINGLRSKINKIEPIITNAFSHNPQAKQSGTSSSTARTSSNQASSSSAQNAQTKSTTSTHTATSTTSTSAPAPGTRGDRVAKALLNAGIDGMGEDVAHQIGITVNNAAKDQEANTVMEYLRTQQKAFYNKKKTRGDIERIIIAALQEEEEQPSEPSAPKEDRASASKTHSTSTETNAESTSTPKSPDTKPKRPWPPATSPELRQKKNAEATRLVKLAADALKESLEEIKNWYHAHPAPAQAKPEDVQNLLALYNKAAQRANQISGALTPEARVNLAKYLLALKFQFNPQTKTWSAPSFAQKKNLRENLEEIIPQKAWNILGDNPKAFLDKLERFLKKLNRGDGANAKKIEGFLQTEYPTWAAGNIKSYARVVQEAFETSASQAEEASKPMEQAPAKSEFEDIDDLERDLGLSDSDTDLTESEKEFIHGKYHDPYS